MFFNKKIPKFYLSISFIFVIFTLYKLINNIGVVQPIYYFKYLLIFVFFFILSLITFFLNDKLNEILFIIFLSCVFSIYSFELFKTLRSKNIYEIYKIKTGKEFDTRSKFKIYNDELKMGNVTVTVHPRNYIAKDNLEIFPLSGISNTKTIFCNENGYYAIYESDRFGFNNPDSEWEDNEIEYLLIGDSYLHGACVNRPNDISSVLRDLSKKSVVNLGYGGNGPLMEYATLREYLSPKVKNIIWFYAEANDQRNLDDDLRSKILMSYLNDENFKQNLKGKQKKIDSMNYEMIREKKIEIIPVDDKKIDDDLKNNTKKFNLFKFLRLVETRRLLNGVFQIKWDINLKRKMPSAAFKTILLKAKKLAESNNSKFFFVYLPEWERYIYKYDDNPRKEIKSILKDLDITLIDLHKIFFKDKITPTKYFPFGNNGHYNEDGYKKITLEIYKFITNMNN